MSVRSVERGFLISFDSRLVPSASGLMYVGGCALFALALLFGGGTKQGLWSDALVEIVALPVLAIAVWNLRSLKADHVVRYGLLLTLAAVAIPLLELVPLPPWLWHALPGRSQIAAELGLVGLGQTWQPLTLAPRECWMAFLALLPAVASFLVTLQLDEARRRSLILVFLGWICAGIGLSFVQMLGGVASPFRFYIDTNLDRAVGFFANSNHNALALALAVPFLMLSAFTARSERVNPARALMAAALLILVVVAISLTRSRAGIGLIFLGSALCGAVLFSRTKGSGRRTQYVIIALCLAAAAVFAAFQAGFVALSDRFQAPLSDDLRWGLLHVSLNAALHYFPIGSGLGSFVPIYERFSPLTLVHEAYVNHAHDDWIELFLELGLLWPLVALAFVAWVGVAASTRWRKFGRLASVQVSACVVALLLMAVASAMDYPLRTVALLSVFGVVCGLLVEPPASRPGAGGRKTGSMA